MSSTANPSAELVSVTLTERAFVCPTGGGFETERWRVRLNDGWMPISMLVWRKSIGRVAAELLDEDDPGGVGSSSKWSDRAPQQWFQRRTHVVAPIGTRFCRRTWRPVRDPNRLLEYPLPQRVIDEYFELRASGLVSARVLEQRAAEREARRRSAAVPELTREENEAYASTLLSRLNSGAPPTTAAPVEEASRPPRFRRPPLIDRRTTHPPGHPEKKDKIA